MLAAGQRNTAYLKYNLPGRCWLQKPPGRCWACCLHGDRTGLALRCCGCAHGLSPCRLRLLSGQCLWNGARRGLPILSFVCRSGNDMSCQVQVSGVSCSRHPVHRVLISHSNACRQEPWLGRARKSLTLETKQTLERSFAPQGWLLLCRLRIGLPAIVRQIERGGLHQLSSNLLSSLSGERHRRQP